MVNKTEFAAIKLLVNNHTGDIIIPEMLINGFYFHDIFYDKSDELTFTHQVQHQIRTTQFIPV